MSTTNPSRPEPFLKSVARAYLERYEDISDLCFLFPNKRSGTFFLRYIKKLSGGKAMIAPAVMTISDFLGLLSGKVVASRIDMLFLLYNCYKEILRLQGKEEDRENIVNENDEDPEEISFDSFRNWGETVISDFNTVDQYLINSDEIFQNLKDFREIATDFLTDEQKEIMEEYFGYEDYSIDDSFWRNFEENDENMSEVKYKFTHLWRILAPLYSLFSKKLDEQGLVSPGGIYRKAYEKLTEKGKKLIPYRKLVAVGFNALSTSEYSIFRELQDMESDENDDYIDFIWDATGPVLESHNNSASKFIDINRRHFPSPEWINCYLKASENDELPSIKVIGSPSNSSQVKVTSILLENLTKTIDATEFEEAKIAVVLPDEDLLIPMLYSLPKGIENVNLTMGYSLKLTSVVSFVSLLRRTFFDSRETTEGDILFFHKDLRLLLKHPYTILYFGDSSIEEILKKLDELHSITVSLAKLEEICKKEIPILKFPKKDSQPNEVIAYLQNTLNEIDSKISKGGNKSGTLESSCIRCYGDALKRLEDTIDQYEVKMKPSSTFRLVDRLISQEKVTFEGEPLRGLQVMGMLETRSLDFDHVFILSMNERIMPLKARTRSFIPATLRTAFGLPPANYSEEIFSYYFYRAISRAKNVFLLYDSRTGLGVGGNGKSRYILQLDYLFAKNRIKHENWNFSLSVEEPANPLVEKKDYIKKRLESFNMEGGKNFSASSLINYRKCELKFFFKNILNISDDPEVSDQIDSIAIGNILHKTMQNLYLPDTQMQGKMLEKPSVITADYIEKILNDGERIRLEVRKAVFSEFLKRSDPNEELSVSHDMIASQIEKDVKTILKHDLSLTPFRLYGVEIDEVLRIKLRSGRIVNFRFAIDRLDEITVDGKKQLRIVDYKTGINKREARNDEDIFTDYYKAEHIFQLFTYAWLLEKRQTGKSEIGKSQSEESLNVRTEIYNVIDILKGIEGLPQIDEKKVTGFENWYEFFDERIDRMIENIFLQEKFSPCESSDSCKLCMYNAICRR